MTDLKYPRLIRAAAAACWAIEPGRLQDIADVLAFQASGGKLSPADLLEFLALHPARGVDPDDDRLWSADGRGGRAGRGAVAIVPLRGIIAHRASQVDNSSGPGGTSTERFNRALREADANPDVGSILIDIDSPGGTTDGVQESAAVVREVARRKPVVAHANARATSAAYWIGSQAGEFVMTPSGEVGSIGVYAMHKDLSEKLAAQGVKTTLISAGKHKVEGHEFGPLDTDARAAIQGRVDDYYDAFVRDVARGRGVSVATVRGEAFGAGRTLGAEAARRGGMVDRVEDFDATLRRLAAGRGPATRSARAAVAALPGWSPAIAIGDRRIKTLLDDGKADIVEPADGADLQEVDLDSAEAFAFAVSRVWRDRKLVYQAPDDDGGLAMPENVAREIAKMFEVPAHLLVPSGRFRNWRDWNSGRDQRRRSRYDFAFL